MEEFSGLLSLPEEKIEEICYQMDDVTLARFLKVSKNTKRICNKVLENRDEVYKNKINEIMNKADLTGSTIYLQSLDTDRTFELSRGKVVYFLAERIKKPVFALQKYGNSVSYYTHVDDIFDRNDISELLLDLVHRGYITV